MSEDQSATKFSLMLNKMDFYGSIIMCVFLCMMNRKSIEFSLNIFIVHRLRKKFVQLILFSPDSAAWELHQYSRRMCGPIKMPKLTPTPGNRTWDLGTPNPTTTETLKHLTLHSQSTVHI